MHTVCHLSKPYQVPVCTSWSIFSRFVHGTELSTQQATRRLQSRYWTWNLANKVYMTVHNRTTVKSIIVFVLGHTPRCDSGSSEANYFWIRNIISGRVSARMLNTMFLYHWHCFPLCNLSTFIIDVVWKSDPNTNIFSMQCSSQFIIEFYGAFFMENRYCRNLWECPFVFCCIVVSPESWQWQLMFCDFFQLQDINLHRIYEWWVTAAWIRKTSSFHQYRKHRTQKIITITLCHTSSSP